jgi:hypothetical protein
LGSGELLRWHADVCFVAHYGLKADLARGPKNAKKKAKRVPNAMVAVFTSILSCRKGGKTANIHASSAEIRRNPG